MNDQQHDYILDRVVGRCKIALSCDAELDEFLIVENYDDVSKLLAAITELRTLYRSKQGAEL